MIINLFINPNPVYSHPYTWHLLYFLGRLALTSYPPPFPYLQPPSRTLYSYRIMAPNIGLGVSLREMWGWRGRQEKAGEVTV
jgi:hypothetical protein